MRRALDVFSLPNRVFSTGPRDGSGPFSPFLIYIIFSYQKKKKGFIPCVRECTISCSRMVYVPKQANSVSIFQYIDFMNLAIAEILL